MTTQKFKSGDLVITAEGHPGPGQWNMTTPRAPVLLLKHCPFSQCAERHSWWEVLGGDNSWWEVLVAGEIQVWRAQFIEIFCEKIM